MVWSVQSNFVGTITDRYRIRLNAHKADVNFIKEDQLSWKTCQNKNVALAVAHVHNAVAFLDENGSVSRPPNMLIWAISILSKKGSLLSR